MVHFRHAQNHGRAGRGGENENTCLKGKCKREKANGKIAEEGIDDQLQRADQIDDGARKQIFEGNGCKADPKNDHAERGRHIGKKLNGVRHDFGKIAFDAEKVERQSDRKS